MEKLIFQIFGFFIFLLATPLLALAFSWLPMIAWNNSLHLIFPSIPAITYWQAFWLTVLSGWVVHRPSVEVKK